MGDTEFEKLSNALAPFLGLWQSGRVACIAIGKSDRLISLATRVSLREDQALSNKPLYFFEDVDLTSHFLAIAVDYPIHSVTQLLHGIVGEGFFQLEDGQYIYEIYLTRAHAGLLGATERRFNWLQVATYQRPNVPDKYGVKRPCIVLDGYQEQTNDLVTPDLLEKVGSKLRLQQPPVDGVEELFSRLMPGTSLNTSTVARVEMIAPLPFDLGYNHERGLRLKALKRAFDNDIHVSVFFKPVGPSLSRPIKIADAKEIDQTGVMEWEEPVKWPEAAEFGKAVLLYRETTIDTLEFRRWPAPNLPISVDTYFDPGHKCLHSFVLGENKKTGQNFEQGVVRLLNLLGVRLIWYGKGATPGRPDVAAAMVQTEGARVIVLGECTREKPDAKFSALADRAKELSQYLKGQAEVLPVVFTPVEPVNSDAQRAAEHGIALIGRKELESLFEALEASVTPEGIISFLRSFATLAPRVARAFRSPFKS